MIRGGVSVLGVLAVLLVGAGPAGAVIPTGNLLADQNPGAELGPSSSTGNDVFTPPGWTPVPVASYSPRATTVRYGAAGGFPTVAQGTAIGGGNSFFAGGPSGTGDKGAAGLALQPVALPASVLSDVDSGNVQATLSACLGGYANQDDFADVSANYTDAGGAFKANELADGPTASQRGGQTKLVPAASAPITLPAGTRQLATYLFFARSPNTAGGYNDGYADNVSVRLSRAGGPSPAADCPPAGGGGGSGGGGSGKQNTPSGINTTVPISRVGKRLTLKGTNALVKLRCTLHDSNCKGTLGLAATGLPKAKATAAKSKATKLGSAKFNIAAGKTKTIKVKLKRSIRKRLAKLSTKRLKKLKITATAKIGGESTKFSLGAVRKH
jgi:hypothetical protein